MPRKVRRIKGWVKIKERYKYNKELGKPRKHHFSIADKVLATNHYLKQRMTALEIENKLSIPENSI